LIPSSIVLTTLTVPSVNADASTVRLYTHPEHVVITGVVELAFESVSTTVTSSPSFVHTPLTGYTLAFASEIGSGTVCVIVGTIVSLLTVSESLTGGLVSSSIVLVEVIVPSSSPDTSTVTEYVPSVPQVVVTDVVVFVPSVSSILIESHGALHTQLIG